jgi:hypothetical protein
MQKYAVIIGNNREDYERVVNALKDAGFEMLVCAGSTVRPILTINECQNGVVGAMLGRYSMRFAEHGFQIIFPDDVILHAKELDGAKDIPIKMTVAQICAALGKNIEIVKG